MSSGLVPGAGLTKNDVNYRHHEQCSSCDNFFPMNSCRIVDGNISADAVCNKWQIKAETGPKAKDFYQKEYDKTKGTE